MGFMVFKFIMNKSLISDNEIFQEIFETKETYEIPINMNLIKLELNKRSIKRNKTIHKKSILKSNEINIIKIHNNHIFSNNKKKAHINKLLKIQFFYGVEMSAETKLYITKMLQAAGKYVIAYGDGMNDYYMLKQANEGYLFAKQDGSLSRSLEGRDTEGLIIV